jgi:hypothetical protein
MRDATSGMQKTVRLYCFLVTPMQLGSDPNGEPEGVINVFITVFRSFRKGH